MARQPKVQRGDKVACSKCGGEHELEGSTSPDGVVDPLLFYKCGDISYLGAVDGRLIIDQPAGISGQI